MPRGAGVVARRRPAALSFAGSQFYYEAAPKQVRGRAHGGGRAARARAGGLPRWFRRCGGKVPAWRLCSSGECVENGN